MKIKFNTVFTVTTIGRVTRGTFDGLKKYCKQRGIAIKRVKQDSYGYYIQRRNGGKK